jgi:hypothetical protein
MLHNVKKDLMSPISELMSSSAFHSIKCSFGAFGPSGPPLLVSPLKSLALDDGLTELLTYYILWLLEENAGESKETISTSFLVEFCVGSLS